MLKILALGVSVALGSTVAYSAPMEGPIVEQVRSFDSLQGPLFQELDDLNTMIDNQLSQFGYDFSKMPEDQLTEFIESQKEYVNMLSAVTAALSSIYFSKEYTNDEPSADEELSAATKAVFKRCGIIKKVTNNCLDRKERLLFQAEFLNEKILDLELQKTTLLNGINFEIDQEIPTHTL